MNRPNARRPLFESLESRQLFASAAALPDLVPTVAFKPPAVVAPGTTIAPAVTITNSGAAIAKKTKVPVSLYASPTPTLAAGATPFKTVQRNLTLAAGASANVKLSATIPASLKLEHYYLIVRVNDNKALAESDFKNNTAVVPRPLNNPVGTYTGHTTTTVGSQPGTLSLVISPGPSSSSTTTTAPSLLTDLSFVSGGVPVHLTGLKSKFSSAGVFHIKSKGALKPPAFGSRASYNLAVHATLSKNNTLTGTIHFHWQSTTDSRNTTSTFTLTRK